MYSSLELAPLVHFFLSSSSSIYFFFRIGTYLPPPAVEDVREESTAKIKYLGGAFPPQYLLVNDVMRTMSRTRCEDDDGE